MGGGSEEGPKGEEGAGGEGNAKEVGEMEVLEYHCWEAQSCPWLVEDDARNVNRKAYDCWSLSGVL